MSGSSVLQLEELARHELRPALFEYVLAIGDDLLILGHQLSKWCGHAPMLEEELALANIALDCLGQAKAFLQLAGILERKGRDEDRLTFFRTAREFRNCVLVEQDNGDFAHTMCRQYLFDSYFVLLMSELKSSPVRPLSDLAVKAYGEGAYHLRHSSEWFLRLGNGTAESNQRLQRSLDDFWPFTGELFISIPGTEQLTAKSLVPAPDSLREKWHKPAAAFAAKANLHLTDKPSESTLLGRSGLHSEYLGHLLADMQSTARSFPDVYW